MFDAAVDNGAGQAVASGCLGSKADGQLGDKTMAAVRAAKVQEVQVKFQASRSLTMASLSTWPTLWPGVGTAPVSTAVCGDDDGEPEDDA